MLNTYCMVQCSLQLCKIYISLLRRICTNKTFKETLTKEMAVGEFHKTAKVTKDSLAQQGRLHVWLYAIFTMYVAKYWVHSSGQ